MAGRGKLAICGVLLQDERGRIQREVKGLRAGWEAADSRAREFERQSLVEALDVLHRLPVRRLHLPT